MEGTVKRRTTRVSQADLNWTIELSPLEFQKTRHLQMAENGWMTYGNARKDRLTLQFLNYPKEPGKFGVIYPHGHFSMATKGHKTVSYSAGRAKALTQATEPGFWVNAARYHAINCKF